jgi:hypothetical protein
MQTLVRLAFAFGLLWLGTALPANAQSQCNSNTPAGTVCARGAGLPGPAQAIPFATFATILDQLNGGVPAVLVGPNTTVRGHLVTWTSSTGQTVGDPGVAITGTGTIALGTAGGISIASGAKLSDTSTAGANILLGTPTVPSPNNPLPVGSFQAWVGATGCSISIKSITAGGTVTCSTPTGTDQKSIASPTAPSSTSAFLMQGLAGAITPTASGNMLITIAGTMVTTNGTIDFGVAYQVSYGTGTAPTSNAALTGTQAGTVQTYTTGAAVTAGDVAQPFSVTVLVTGLTPGTTYWVDLAAKAIGLPSAYSFSAASVTAAEI